MNRGNNEVGKKVIRNGNGKDTKKVSKTFFFIFICTSKCTLSVKNTVAFWNIMTPWHSFGSLLISMYILAKVTPDHIKLIAYITKNSNLYFFMNRLPSKWVFVANKNDCNYIENYHHY